MSCQTIRLSITVTSMAKSYLCRRVKSTKDADTGISIILALATDAAPGRPIWETMHDYESVKFAMGCHGVCLFAFLPYLRNPVK
uniref:DUF3817 domain-containing protein n=1 Tax=Angiostrongylus cantonensis TaxID=6313 RepID=A0A0K0DMI6_ANGCA